MTIMTIMAAVSSASASETVAVGHLDCGINGGVSFIFGSTRELRCVFRPRLGVEGELYEGQIKKYGLDIGVTNNARLTWVVLAPTELPVNEGALMFSQVEDLLPVISFGSKKDSETEKKHSEFVERMVTRGYTERQVRRLVEWYMRVRQAG